MSRAGGGAAAGTVAALALLSGCAGPAGPAGAEVALVRVTGSGFQPATLVIPVGTEVRWVNQDYVAHTVTAGDELVAGEPALPEGAQAWDSGRLFEGQTFARRFGVEGTYVYHSIKPQGTRLVGTLRVERP